MTQPDLDAAAAPSTGGRRARRKTPGDGSPRPRRRVTVVGVLGEVLITAGVLVLAFIGWQQWLNDIIVGNQLNGQSIKQSQEWNSAASAAPTTAPVDPAAPPVLTTTLVHAKPFASLIVPRFGADYYRPIAQGTDDSDVLNKGYLGHYETSQLPGQLGNFAIASHRKAYGGNLEHINDLKVGDHIFVETQDGWYQYEFRNLQYVKPTGVGVIDPVPDQTGLQPTDRMITLTSCNPFFSTAERIIAYGSFDKFYPRAGGPPAEIAATVTGKA